MPDENQPLEPTDPNFSTEIDGAAAFRMGESPQIDPTGWQPPKPEELDPLFADYLVTDLLGRGGMGAVYKAVQTKLKRTVAIKLLPPEMAQIDPTFKERFQREAEAMAAMDHPNIVTVFDFGVTSMGHSFFVMEFVDGMDFHQLIHSGQLDPAGALNAVSQICDALQYAHEQGYVHRDIKPANIFINQKGILKVGDFGLAKITGSDSPKESATPSLTRTGIGMGTPFYSAPEQLDGREVDHRADIYSLGVMFYEMLTREIPRGAVNPPSQKVPVDMRVDGVVMRAIQQERDQRYQSVSEVRTDVEQIRRTPPPGELAKATPVAVQQMDSSPGPRQTAAPIPSGKTNILSSCFGGLSIVGSLLAIVICVAFVGWWVGKDKKPSEATYSPPTPVQVPPPVPKTDPVTTPTAPKEVPQRGEPAAVRPSVPMSKPVVVEPPAPVKNAIDLLKLVAGKEAQQDGSVSVSSDEIESKIELSELDTNYRIDFEVERLSGSGTFLLGLSHAGESFVVKIDHRLSGQLRRCHGIGNSHIRWTEDQTLDPPPPGIPVRGTVSGSVEANSHEIILRVGEEYLFRQELTDLKPGMPKIRFPFFVGALFVEREPDTKFKIKHLQLSSIDKPSLPPRTNLRTVSIPADSSPEPNPDEKSELSELDQLYLSALQRTHAEATKNGRAELANILEHEAQQIRSGAGVPKTDTPQTPIELQKLRQVWRQEKSKRK